MFFLHFPVFRIEYYGLEVLFLTVFIALFALFLLHKKGVIYSKKILVISILLLFIAFDMRYHVLRTITGDYKIYLSHWVDHYRQNGGFSAFDTVYYNCNYNVPYLYFLALFSYSRINDLYLIKLLSVFFDVILAYACFNLVSIFSSSKRLQLITFFAVLFTPSVYINSAYWGQCDSIYVSFAVLSIYFALDDHPVKSMIMIAISFAFKLQAIFIMPVFAVLWIFGKIKFKHFFVFPLTYLIMILPAVAMGRSFIDTLFLYTTIPSSNGVALNHNSASIFALLKFSEENIPIVTTVSIIFAFTVLLMIIGLCFFNRKRLTKETVLFVAMIFSAIIPFLLPRMHDRYFYSAEILAIVVSLIYRKYCYISILSQLAALNMYLICLSGNGEDIIPMYLCSIAYIVIILSIFFAIFGSFSNYAVSKDANQISA